MVRKAYGSLNQLDQSRIRTAAGMASISNFVERRAGLAGEVKE